MNNIQSLNQNIEDHYSKPDLFGDILRRLQERGIEPDQVKRSDIAGVDEFHVRGAAVSMELANSIAMNGLHVLDVGCGLGGPCRLLADEFNCTTKGIDLSEEYIRTATALSKLVNLDEKTAFIQGNATQLPYADSSFDVVWTQHVQMNVPDKRKFYAEIDRVLKPAGHFLYYDIFRNSDGEVIYPMPWANSRELSFLFEAREMDTILTDLGLMRTLSKDQTEAGIGFFTALVSNPKGYGPHKIGLSVLMGELTKPKMLNLLKHLQNGVLILEMGVYKKQDFAG